MEFNYIIIIIKIINILMYLFKIIIFKKLKILIILLELSLIICNVNLLKNVLITLILFLI